MDLRINFSPDPENPAFEKVVTFDPDVIDYTDKLYRSQVLVNVTMEEKKEMLERVLENVTTEKAGLVGVKDDHEGGPLYRFHQTFVDVVKPLVEDNSTIGISDEKSREAVQFLDYIIQYTTNHVKGLLQDAKDHSKPFSDFIELGFKNDPYEFQRLEELMHNNLTYYSVSDFRETVRGFREVAVARDYLKELLGYTPQLN